MWYSPLYLELYSRERQRELTGEMALCRLAEAQKPERPSRPRWRRLLAGRLATLSLRLDDRAALAALKAGFFLR